MWRHKHPPPPKDTHLGSGANLSTSKRAYDLVSHTHYLRVFATGQSSEDIFVSQHSTCQPASLEHICLFTHSWFTRLGNHGSNPDRDKRYLFSKEAKTNLRPIRVSEALPPGGEGNSAAAWSTPHTPIFYQGEEWVELYLHCPICRHAYHNYSFIITSRDSAWGFASDVVYRQFREHADGSSNSIKVLNLFYVIRRLVSLLFLAEIVMVRLQQLLSCPQKPDSRILSVHQPEHGTLHWASWFFPVNSRYVNIRTGNCLCPLDVTSCC